LVGKLQQRVRPQEKKRTSSRKYLGGGWKGEPGGPFGIKKKGEKRKAGRDVSEGGRTEPRKTEKKKGKKGYNEEFPSRVGGGVRD